jgi:hypothetical protein
MNVYVLDDRGSIPGSDKDVPLRHNVQTGSGVHPASCPVSNSGYILGVTRPEREGNHAFPSSAEVKNSWSYTSIALYVFMACA